MKKSTLLPLLLAALVAALWAGPAPSAARGPGLVFKATAVAQPPKRPINRDGLVKALKLNALTAAELIEQIRRRGVAFRLTPEAEQELKAAGAGPQVIEAVRTNYREPAGGAAAQPAAPAKGDDDDEAGGAGQGGGAAKSARKAEPAAQEVSQPQRKAGGKAEGLVGTWYYIAFVNADGSETEITNREGFLDLKADGTFENSLGSLSGGHSQVGTYSVSGGRLTLNAENYEPKTYAMTFGNDGKRTYQLSGRTLKLVKKDGIGYKLER